MSDSSLTPGRPMLAEIILPELVWEKALEFLRDPEDILNCGKTCTLFQRLLHSQMVAINLGKTFPVLMDYLDNKSILNCRSVSKGWRGAVDNYFENYTLEKTVHDELRKILKQFRASATQFSPYLYNFLVRSNYDSGWENSDYERFAREMKDHPRNPFIGHAVLFRFYSNVDNEQNLHAFRTLYNFLEIFGTHIWCLDLEINDGGLLEKYSIQVREEYIFPLIIRDVFVLAPNLKKFKLSGNFDSFRAANQSLSVEEIRALAPAPTLENLNIQSIHFSRNDNARVRGYIDKSILLRHSNTNLRVLHIKSIELMRDLNWPNLEELHVTENLYPDSETNVIRYPGTNMRLFDPMLINLIRVPNLELLSLTLWSCKLTQELKRKTLEDLFRALGNLCIASPNLKTLRFKNTWLWDKDLDKPTSICGDLRCPENIKTLEIHEGYVGFLRDQHVISDYSFLLHFPQVEKIRILEYGVEFTTQEVKKISAREIVEVHKFMYCGRMYESNIWKLLPSLKEFSFKKSIYTRSAYERRLKRV